MFLNFVRIEWICIVFLIVTVEFLCAGKPFRDYVCSEVFIEKDLGNFKSLDRCRIIDGSLIISDIKDENITKLKFSSLTEITGFLKIFRTENLFSLGDLFPNLAIIRGINLHHNKTALEVTDNEDLNEMGLKSLRFIENGNVHIRRNNKLCFAETVKWSVIAPYSTENVIENSQKDCKSCVDGLNCWNSEIPQVICDASCETRFCASSEVCCDSECIGGCAKNDSSKCTACENFLFDGLCVDKCPSHSFEFKNRFCISAEECWSERDSKNNSFIPFDGECREKCQSGFALLSIDDSTHRFTCAKECHNISITSETNQEKLKDLMGCEVIRGYLKIEKLSDIFCYESEGSSFKTNLEQILSSIVEIDGYLKITNSSMIFDLAIFENLKRITGRNLYSEKYSLVLKENENLNFLWPPHRSVSIDRGEILIESNENLCDNCDNLDVDIKAKLYTAVFSWNIPTFVNSSDVHRYTFSIYNASKTKLCYNKIVTEENFSTANNSYITYKLQPKSVFYFQLCLVNSSFHPIAMSSLTKFETSPAFIDEIIFPSIASDSITIEWKKPKQNLKNLVGYEVKAFHNRLNEKFYDEFDNCLISSADKPFTNVVQVGLTSLELANYDWMTEQVQSLFYKELMNEKLPKTRIGHEFIFEDVSATATKLTLNQMESFAFYYISVRACFNESSGNESRISCSEPTIQLTQTKSDVSVDKITDLSVESSEPNTMVISWKNPAKPNGLIHNIVIYYKLVGAIESDAKTLCVPFKEFKAGEKKVISNVMAGNYTIAIMLRSLAGMGELSMPEFIEVKNKSNFQLYLTIFSLAIILFVLVFLLSMTQRKKVHLLNSTRNPFYLPYVHVPDDGYEIKRGNIEILHELGAGNFGKVYEGILKKEGENENGLRVAIKTVNDSASEVDCASFLNEASVMKNFKTEHIIKLLGIVSKSHPCLVVMELMSNGDLKSFLRKNRPPERATISDNYTTFPLVQVIPPVEHMAIQIADGMKYLTQMKFVHRDLASRNCMVAADCTVKIGDFGLTRDIYEADYYRKRGKGLMPVRWMAPESLRDAVYSCQSDVFSYGVVLYEIVTYAAQPYQGVSNEQVLIHIIQGRTLERPENTSDKMYKIMKCCWKYNPADRISFTDIIEELLDEAPQKFLEKSFYCLNV